MINLNLAVGANEQTASFDVTNHYGAPVVLHFSAETRPGVPAPKEFDPNSVLAFGATDVTVAAGETFRQKVTLLDSEQLPPGSQLADLVMTQSSSASGQVNVLPSIRMPLTIIKQSGAITKIGLTSASSPWLSLVLPSSLKTTIANQGNMIAIPRGFITVSRADGTIVSKGVMNEASQAVSPGSSLKLDTPMRTMGRALLPGAYHITVSYGLGADNKPVVASATFLYIAWWHVLVLAALVIGTYFGIRQLRRMRRHRPAHAHGPPRQTALAGRDT